MSKTRDTGFLANVIQVHDTGVRIMSGSTMLMAVSSSGAVTITGEISGSDAANSLLLSGTGSVGFTTTASFLAVSSSQQEVSASYISLSGSYNTFSGSASTRITVDSASLLQVSASYIALSGSYNTFSGSASTRTTQIENVYATTGSNSFRANQSITGSLVVSSTITAQTLVVQTVTSSIVYSSGSNIFGCDLNSRQTFTGSVLVTGSLTIAGGGNVSAPTIFGSTIACSPIGCFATSCATSFIGGTMSGTTIYGSTAVCSPVGKFTTCLDLGGALTGTSATFSMPSGNGALTIANSCLSGKNWTLLPNTNGAESDLLLYYAGASAGTRLTIASTGAATFSSSVTTGGGLSVAGNITTTNGAGTTYNQFANSGNDVIWENRQNGNIIIRSDSSTERMRITSTGIACFACQVCAPSFNSTSTSYLNGLVVSCNVSSNCFTGITVVNSAGGGSECSRAGIAFQSYDWVQSAIWHGRQTSAAFEGALLFGTNPNTANLGVGGVCTRLRIDNTGIACFACQVCAPSGVKFGSGTTTLNYYEEGSWTPTFSNSSTTPSYSTQTGKYTRIGRVVHVVGKIGASNLGSGTVYIGGLPFSSADANDAGQRVSPRGEGDWSGFCSTTLLTSTMFRTSGTTFIGVRDNGSGQSIYADHSTYSSTLYFNFHATYYV